MASGPGEPARSPLTEDLLVGELGVVAAGDRVVVLHGGDGRVVVLEVRVVVVDRHVVVLDRGRDRGVVVLGVRRAVVLDVAAVGAAAADRDGRAVVDGDVREV